MERGPEATANPVGAQPATILIMADSDLMRHMLEEVVRRIGWRLDALRLEARDAQEGMAFFHRHSAAIACVVFDVDEPEANGLAAYCAFRSARADLPIIFLSDFGAALAGAARHDPLVAEIEKPFGLATLRESLWRLLGPQYIARLRR